MAVAVANRMARIIWTVLVEGEQPGPQNVTRRPTLFMGRDSSPAGRRMSCCVPPPGFLEVP